MFVPANFKFGSVPVDPSTLATMATIVYNLVEHTVHWLGVFLVILYFQRKLWRHGWIPAGTVEPPTGIAGVLYLFRAARQKRLLSGFTLTVTALTLFQIAGSVLEGFMVGGISPGLGCKARKVWSNNALCFDETARAWREPPAVVLGRLVQLNDDSGLLQVLAIEFIPRVFEFSEKQIVAGPSEGPVEAVVRPSDDCEWHNDTVQINVSVTVDGTGRLNEPRAVTEYLTNLLSSSSPASVACATEPISTTAKFSRDPDAPYHMTQGLLTLCHQMETWNTVMVFYSLEDAIPGYNRTVGVPEDRWNSTVDFLADGSLTQTKCKVRYSNLKYDVHTALASAAWYAHGLHMEDPDSRAAGLALLVSSLSKSSHCSDYVFRQGPCTRLERSFYAISGLIIILLLAHAVAALLLYCVVPSRLVWFPTTSGDVASFAVGEGKPPVWVVRDVSGDDDSGNYMLDLSESGSHVPVARPQWRNSDVVRTSERGGEEER